MFDDDDDDPLGALCFDESPRREAPAALKHQAAKEDGAKGRSIMDDLLGTGPSTPSKPTPSSSGGKREFVLDKKYLKQEGWCSTGSFMKALHLDTFWEYKEKLAMIFSQYPFIDTLFSHVISRQIQFNYSLFMTWFCIFS